MEDIFKDLGEMALASRMKRLSDYFMREVTAVYQSQDLDFEARWFPTFYTIWKKDIIGITDLAEVLNISHPAVIQICKELENKDLIHSEKSKKDNRKRLLRLTTKGQTLIPKLQKLWDAMSKVNLVLLRQQKNNLLFALEEMESLLNQKSHYERIMEQVKSQQLEEIHIIDFVEKYANDFKNLNYEWIEKYFKIEEPDRQVLENPQTYILDRGGHIFFAKVENQIVGTCALLKETNDCFELAKMAVSPAFQGRQIGKKLCLHAIEAARSLGAKQVVLESNTKLNPAIEMYKKVGFYKVEIVGHPSPYERSNIKMQLDL
jgi:DNA-binding MarR family transcriptional regulator/predicted GNAT family N-acyltransferase